MIDLMAILFVIGVATGIIFACNKERIMLWWYDMKDIMESKKKKSKKKKGKKKNGKRFLR